VLAGRDLKGNGTWLGVSRTGRIAAITNFRDPASLMQDAPSRGILIPNYLTGNLPPQHYLEQVSNMGRRYNGFNLIAGDTSGLYYYSNRSSGVRQLSSGTYGISNHLLDTAWPKIQRGKALLDDQLSGRERLDFKKIWEVLADRSQPPDTELPDTGVGLRWERILSPLFISSPDYGTRCSSIMLFDSRDRVTMLERTFIKAGDKIETGETRSFTFDIHG
jgi:uncharacterized protein with NRDE domain